MEDLSYIPNSLNTAETTPGNLADYIHLVGFFYDSLRVERINENRFIVKIHFFNLGEIEFNQHLQENEIDASFLITQDVAGLYRLLKYIVNPGFRPTRENYDVIATGFQNGNLNTTLRVLARQLDETVNDMTQIVHCFIEVAKYMAKNVEFLLTKTIMAANLYRSIYKWTSQITDLEAQVTDMLLALGDRASVNAKALEVARQRRISSTEYGNYLRYFDNDRYTQIAQHFEGLNIWKVNFVWTELLTRLRDRLIWFNHCCPGDQQVTNILEDVTLSVISNRLDQCIEKIRSYAPSVDIENISKRDRMAARVTQLQKEMLDFNTKKLERNVSKAKIMIKSFEFLNQQLEILHVDGIDYTEDNVGTSSVKLAGHIEELEKYISEQEEFKRQKELTTRISSMEFSKSMPGLKLQKLSGFETYLSWITSFNQMKRMVTNPYSKLALIKASLEDPVDIEFLKHTSSVDDCLKYIKDKYSDTTEILHHEKEKLYSLKDCGENLEIAEKNQQTFILTKNLLEQHGLLKFFDIIVRARLMNKLMTENQKTMYMNELVRSEEYWRRTFSSNLEDAEDNDDIQDIHINTLMARSSKSPNRQGEITPFATPCGSPATGPEASSSSTRTYTKDQIEALIEKRKREHFLRHVERYYQSTRRIVKARKLTKSREVENKPRRVKRTERGLEKESPEKEERTEAFATGYYQRVECHYCRQHHRRSFFFCLRFRKLSVPKRQELLENDYPEACIVCLAPDSVDEDHSNGYCGVQRRLRLKCKACGDKDHNTLIHSNQEYDQGEDSELEQDEEEEETYYNCYQADSEDDSDF